MNEERYQRGLDAMEEVMGEGGSRGLVALEGEAPDLARPAIEAFGDLYANPTLDVKTRELLTVAALASAVVGADYVVDGGSLKVA